MRQVAFNFDQRKPWKPEPPPTLTGVDVVGFDTETNGLQWWNGHRVVGYAIAWGDKRQYLPVRHKGGENLPEDAVDRFIKHELAGKKLVTLKGQFDAHMSRVSGHDLESYGCRITDVGQSAALLDDHRMSFSLENLSQEHLGEGKVDAGLDMSAIEDYPAGMVREYAEGDVDRTLRLFHKFQPMLAEQELLEVQALEDEVIWVTVEMEKNGTQLNEPLLRRWINQSEQELLGCVMALQELTGVKVNPRSGADAARVFDACGLFRPVDFTADRLKEYDHPAILKLIRGRDLESLRSKFLLNYLEQIHRCGGILRYALHQLASDEGGTVSGRYSSSALIRTPKVGVNIQQVSNPKKQKARYNSDKYIIRKLFVPRAGRKWYKADAKQIEYRMFAHLAKNPTILKAYEDDPNTDYHNLLLDMVRTVKPTMTRDRQKDVNFAFIYGAGIAKMATMIKITEDETRSIVDAFVEIMPEAKKLIDEASYIAKTRGFVKTLMGRRARFPGGEFSYSALNRVIQGGAADVNKKKLVELHKERKNTDFFMYFTVHDEVDGDVPDQHSADMVTEILNRQSFPKLRVPILWDSGIGENWAELG